MTVARPYNSKDDAIEVQHSRRKRKGDTKEMDNLTTRTRKDEKTSRITTSDEREEREKFPN